MTVVRLRASAGDAMQANVKSFCETGTLSYSLDAATAALRSSVSSMRVVTAQAFGPRSAAGGGSEPERNRREVAAETWSVDRDSFGPTPLQLMQSVGEAYRAQKDRIILCLKLLHGSVDYVLCADNLFLYEHVRRRSWNPSSRLFLWTGCGGTPKM